MKNCQARNNIMTPEQCKVARTFLKWHQEDLANKVRLTKKTIADFERGARIPYWRTLEDIEKTFEDAGIIFEENEEEYTVKLLKNKRDKNNRTNSA